MRFYALASSIFLSAFSQLALGSASSHLGPLSERVEKAKFIFVGAPESERREKTPGIDTDWVVRFKVERLLKGDPQSPLDVAYLKKAPKPYSTDFGPDFRRNMQDSFQYAIENHISFLVFVREENKKNITGPEFGTFPMTAKRSGDEVKLIEKLNSEKRN